jgi:hypothetical protein
MTPSRTITASDFRDAFLGSVLVGYDWSGSKHFAQVTLRQLDGVERTFRVEGLKSWAAWETFEAQCIEQCTFLSDAGGIYLCLDPYLEGQRTEDDNFWFVGSSVTEMVR